MRRYLCQFEVTAWCIVKKVTGLAHEKIPSISGHNVTVDTTSGPIDFRSTITNPTFMRARINIILLFGLREKEVAQAERIINQTRKMIH